MKLLFFVCGIGLAYSYFVYPLILSLLPKRRFSTAIAGRAEKMIVSLIITAHNEERRIREKIENSLEIEFPTEQLEIIVASDCSGDHTDEIVLSFAKQGVKLVRADQHLGKEYAQGLAIKAACGEVLVFSDVATQIPKDAFDILLELFSKDEVGAVSSEDRFISDDGQVVGEGLYVRYEMWLRGMESKQAGLVGLSGSFFAARREVCQNWDIRVPSDFNTALNCRVQGYRAVSDERLVGVYKDIKNPAKEYQRKVRTIIRGMQAMGRKLEILNPFVHGLFAFQVWSHKILRWAVPWFMLLFFSLSFVLAAEGPIYQMIFIAQVIFYILMVIAFCAPGLRNIAAVRIPYYFLIANIAAAQAAILYVFGRRVTVWKPSDR